MEQFLDEMDLLIKAAKGNEVKERVVGLRRKEIPRSLLARVARIAWRVNAPLFAIRLLHPVLHGSKSEPASASPAEKAEYGACLIRIGAHEEGMSILTSLDATANPEVFLFQAFGHIGVWEYSSAIPLLRRFLAEPGLNAYQRRIGETNLAASLVHERKAGEAELVLSNILTKNTKEEALVHGFALHLAAENAIYQAKWAEAEGFLDRAAQHLKDCDDRSVFFLRKWQTLLSLMQGGPSGAVLSSIHALKAQAKSLHHWESIRDLDSKIAVAQEDRSLFFKVYFGTPYQEYRDRIHLEMGGRIEIVETYLWQPAEEPGTCIDASTGAILGSESGLKMGRLPHQLFSILCSDLYRPLSLAAVHSKLYPQAYFDPESSPARVRSIKTALRGWLKENKVPLRISSANGFLRLVPYGAVSVKLRLKTENIDRKALLLEKVKEVFPTSPFSTREVGKVLQLSKMSVLRLLQNAKGEGAVFESGQGKRRRYSFAG